VNGDVVAERITVFIVDDHEVVREGLAVLLGREPDIDLVGSAESAEGALELLPSIDPDILVLDHRLPRTDGVALCRELAERRLRTQVVMLSAFQGEEAVAAALHAGARAYVVKDVDPDGLKRAIRAVARGETLIDPKADGRFSQWATRRTPGDTTAPGPWQLGPSQLGILRQLVEGRSTAEIARHSQLSVHTVKGYLRDIYIALGVNNRSEAASVAVRRGLA